MKTRKLLPILFILLLAKTITYAQPQQFYHEFSYLFNDTVPLYFQQNSFQISDSTYLSTGNYGMFFGLAGRVIWDSSGNVLDARYLDLDISIFPEGLTRIDSNRFLLYGASKLFHPETGDYIDQAASLVCFNQAAEVLWYKTYGGYAPGYPDIEAPTYEYLDFFCGAEIDTINERIYAYGESCSFNAEHEDKPYVVCVDYLGDTIWTWTMPDLPNLKNGSLKGATLTKSGDLLLVGNTGRHEGDTEKTFNKGLVIKLSANGEMLWYKLWGDSYPDTFEVLELPDESFVLGGYYTETITPDTDFGIVVGILVKMDALGNVISERVIQRGGYNIIHLYKLIETTEGFAVLGLFRIDDIGNYFLNYYSSDMVCLDEINLVREDYTYGAFGVEGVSKTYDGGFLFTGVGGTDYNVVMKADSLLNFPLSEGWNAIEEPDFKQNISYYPNPAKSILHIESKDNKPLKQIKMYDMFGRIVFEKYSYKKSTQIDVSNIETGIYILLINNQYYGKVLIE
jgi:hypothetical protein